MDVPDGDHGLFVGRSMGKTLATAETIIPAWKMPIRSNNITDRLVFHSDKGSQYASHDFTDVLKVQIAWLYNLCEQERKLLGQCICGILFQERKGRMRVPSKL